MRVDDGLLLGWPYKTEGGRQTVDWSNPIVERGEGHLFMSALTGEGKGVSYVIPSLLSWPGSVIAIDVKGELTAVTARRRREMGQDVYVLDPFCITDVEERASLNPLDVIDPDDPGATSAAVQLGSQLASSVRSDKDPFWHQRAQTLMSSIGLSLVDELGRGEVTLEDVADRVDDPYERLKADTENRPEDARSVAFQDIIAKRIAARLVRDQEEDIEDEEDDTEEEEKEPSFMDKMIKNERRAVRAGVQVLKRNEGRVLQSITSIAAAALGIAEGGTVGKAMAKSTIPIKDIISGKPMSVFIVIPPDKLISHGRLLRMWIGLILTVLAKRRGLKGPQTLLVLDECAQLGRMDELLSAVSLMRAYGVKVLSVWQDLSQLKGKYKSEWETILNGCGTQLWFGLSNNRVAGQAVEGIGAFSKRELAAMDERDAVLVRRHHSPEIVRRPNYLRQETWKGLFDQNPIHCGVDAPDQAQPPNIIDLGSSMTG